MKTTSTTYAEMYEGANRNRPDKENGKYYIYAPTGEVIQRNCVYFGEVARGYKSIFENEDPPVMCANIITNGHKKRRDRNHRRRLFRQEHAA